MQLQPEVSTTITNKPKPPPSQQTAHLFCRDGLLFFYYSSALSESHPNPKMMIPTCGVPDSSTIVDTKTFDLYARSE